MSDELKELKRRLILDIEGEQRYFDSDSAKHVDGLKVALYELDNLDKPHWGG